MLLLFFRIKLYFDSEDFYKTFTVKSDERLNNQRHLFTAVKVPCY